MFGCFLIVRFFLCAVIHCAPVSRDTKRHKFKKSNKKIRRLETDRGQSLVFSFSVNGDIMLLIISFFCSTQFFISNISAALSVL